MTTAKDKIRELFSVCVLLCAGPSVAGTSDPGIGGLIWLAVVGAFIAIGAIFAKAGALLFRFRGALVFGMLWFVGVPASLFLYVKFSDSKLHKLHATTDSVLKRLCSSYANEVILGRAAGAWEIDYFESVESVPVRKDALPRWLVDKGFRIVDPKEYVKMPVGQTRYLVKLETVAVSSEKVPDVRIIHQRISVFDRQQDLKLAQRDVYWSSLTQHRCNLDSEARELIWFDASSTSLLGANFVGSVLSPYDTVGP